MSASFRVISIGTLASNPHWGERGAVRPPHATTTLITSGKAKILVDPSLPAQVLIQRLVERSGISPDEITHVFLTCLNPIHRRGLLAFERAQWLVSEREREAIGGQLVASIKEAHSAGDADLVKTLGPDHLVTRMAATIYGSSETTFYVIAGCFGSVGVHRTRHAVPAGLLAGVAGSIAALTLFGPILG